MTEERIRERTKAMLRKKLYVVLSKGGAAAEEIAKHLPKHLEYMIGLEKTGVLFASGPLKQTARVMVKDENVCLHCGLCAERCPTYAWDMRKFAVLIPHADAVVPATVAV